MHRHQVAFKRRHPTLQLIKLGSALAEPSSTRDGVPWGITPVFVPMTPYSRSRSSSRCWTPLAAASCRSVARCSSRSIAEERTLT